MTEENEFLPLVRALIVDDEQHARIALRRVLAEFDFIEVIAECDNGLEAIKQTQALDPDLMFLDIQMPKLDGFDVVDLLGNAAPEIVFVTAYDEFAIQAFEANAVDYLLKPVSIERIRKTLDRVNVKRGERQSMSTETSQSIVYESQKQSAPLQRVLVRDNTDVHVIAASDIICIEAADDYIVIHTEVRNYIKQDRLQNLENVLDPNVFCRTHRSSLINISHLMGIEAETKNSKVANLKGGLKQPVSRSGYQRLVKLL